MSESGKSRTLMRRALDVLGERGYELSDDGRIRLESNGHQVVVHIVPAGVGVLDVIVVQVSSIDPDSKFLVLGLVNEANFQGSVPTLSFIPPDEGSSGRLVATLALASQVSIGRKHLGDLVEQVIEGAGRAFAAIEEECARLHDGEQSTEDWSEV